MYKVRAIILSEVGGLNTLDSSFVIKCNMPSCCDNKNIAEKYIRILNDNKVKYTRMGTRFINIADMDLVYDTILHRKKYISEMMNSPDLMEILKLFVIKSHTNANDLLSQKKTNFDILTLKSNSSNIQFLKHMAEKLGLYCEEETTKNIYRIGIFIRDIHRYGSKWRVNVPCANVIVHRANVPSKIRHRISRSC